MNWKDCSMNSSSYELRHILWLFFFFFQKRWPLRSWTRPSWTRKPKGSYPARSPAWKNCTIPTSSAFMKSWRLYPSSTWWWSMQGVGSSLGKSALKGSSQNQRASSSSPRLCLPWSTWWAGRGGRVLLPFYPQWEHGALVYHHLSISEDFSPTRADSSPFCESQMSGWDCAPCLRSNAQGSPVARQPLGLCGSWQDSLWAAGWPSPLPWPHAFLQPRLPLLRELASHCFLALPP